MPRLSTPSTVRAVEVGGRTALGPAAPRGPHPDGSAGERALEAPRQSQDRVALRHVPSLGEGASPTTAVQRWLDRRSQPNDTKRTREALTSKGTIREQLPGDGSGSAPERAEDDELRRRFVEAARRADIVGIVNAATSEADLARLVTEELSEVFSAEVAFLLDEGDEANASRALAAIGLEAERALRILDRSEASSAVTHAKPAALTGDDVLGVGLSSAILAPFRTDDGRGVLVGVGRRHERPFEQADRTLLGAVTPAVGQALERIWAYEARDAAAAQQAALVRAAHAMGRSLEIGVVLQTLCDECQAALRTDTTSVSLGDEVDGYVVQGAAGRLGESIGFRLGPGAGLGGRAVHSGRSLVTHSYGEDGYPPSEVPALLEIRSAVAVPLAWDDRPRGYLFCGWLGPRRITAAEVELIEGFAELAGLVSANAERHAAVREAAEVDGLTGCLNRDALQHQLEQRIARSDQTGTPLSVALLDLDGFKSINDVFGHLSGDAVLKSVGAALRSTVRAEDVVVRYGGDEFALILPESTEEWAAPVLDRVRAAIRSMEVPGGKLTACVGLAERAEGETLEQLVGRADEALRDAKGSPGPGSIRRASRRTSAPPVPPRTRPRDPERRQRWRAVAGDIGLAIARHTDTDRRPPSRRSGASRRARARGLRGAAPGPEGKLEEVAASGDLPADRWLLADRGPSARRCGQKRAVLGESGSDRRQRDRRSRSLDEEDLRTPGRKSTELAVPLVIGGPGLGRDRLPVPGRRCWTALDVELVAAVADHLSSAIRRATCTSS